VAPRRARRVSGCAPRARAHAGARARSRRCVPLRYLPVRPRARGPLARPPARSTQASNVSLCLLLALGVIALGELGWQERWRTEANARTELGLAIVLLMIATVPLALALLPLKSGRKLQLRTQKALVAMLVRQQARARGGSSAADTGAAADEVRQQWLSDVIATRRAGGRRRSGDRRNSAASSDRRGSTDRSAGSDPRKASLVRVDDARAPPRQLTDAEVDAARLELDAVLGGGGGGGGGGARSARKSVTIQVGAKAITLPNAAPPARDKPAKPRPPSEPRAPSAPTDPLRV
jgi:uncharacterized membrane protein YgcG